MFEYYNSDNFKWVYIQHPYSGAYLGLLEVSNCRSYFLWTSPVASGPIPAKMKCESQEGVAFAAAVVENCDYTGYLGLLDWLQENSSSFSADIQPRLDYCFNVIRNKVYTNGR